MGRNELLRHRSQGPYTDGTRRSHRPEERPATHSWPRRSPYSSSNSEDVLAWRLAISA